MSNNPKRLSRTPVKNTQPPRDPNTPLTNVEKLALLNRYVFPVVAVFGPVLVAWLMKWELMIPLGIGCYIFGTYQLIGYKNRWDHIYCSIQLFKKQRMTPPCHRLEPLHRLRRHGAAHRICHSGHLRPAVRHQRNELKKKERCVMHRSFYPKSCREPVSQPICSNRDTICSIF